MSAARAILFFLSPVTIAAAASGVALAGGPTCDDLMASLHGLETGSFGERWALIEGGLPALHVFVADPEDAFPECHAEAKARLLRILRTETDDRIVVKILCEIGMYFDDDDPDFTKYLVDALDHRSPNVRREIAGLLSVSPADHAVPRLRSLWREETRPWVRAAVALALARAGDGEIVDEIDTELETAEGLLADDLLAAVERLGDPRSVPAIERMANGPAGERRKRAIDTLTLQANSPAASEALDRLALSDDPALSAAAIEAVSGEPWDPIEALRRILAKASADGNGPAADAANGAIERLTAARDGRESDGVPVPKTHSAPVSHHMPLDVFDERSWCDEYWTVRPAGKMSSARCWNFPGFVDRNHSTQRVPAGAKGMTYEVFEWEGALWVDISGEADGCWMPESSLVPDPDHDAAAPADPPAPAGDVEIDLLRDDLSSRSFRVLEATGFATTFDEDDDVVGVRLGMEGGGSPPIELIFDAWDASEPALARGVRDWLVHHADLWIDRPALVPWLADEAGE